MSSFYVTTPIFYVNDLPHIGHIYTSLVADSMARYRRFLGEDVYFLTGTDEHGQKIERAAADQGIRPIELADRVVARYRELWPILGVEPDDAIRTTEERHLKGVAEIVRRMLANGAIYKGEYKGWYCASEEAFVPDSQVKDGVDVESGRPVELLSEESYFFRLSAYQEPLLEWYRTHPDCIRPKTRYNEVVSFVESGLKDLSVSRASVRWGAPWPDDEGHTVYVWLDALTNYISALGFGRDDQGLYEQFWSGGDERVHLVGKDILRFHAVYWPAFLLAAGLPLPTRIQAHGWWLRDDKKISKSVGVAVRPDDLIERFGSDSLRYYLLRDMAFGQDASFSDEAFVDRYNSDLANDLGNTVSRIVTLTRRAFDGRTPPTAETEGGLPAFAEKAVGRYLEEMETFQFHRALEALWSLLSEVNQHLVTNEPWKLIKNEDERPRLARVLWTAIEGARIVITGLLPFMPRTAERLLGDLGCPVVAKARALAWGGTPTGAEIPKSEPRFPRIDKAAYLGDAADAPKAPGKEAKKKGKGDTKPKGDEKADGGGPISIDQFMDVELRAGTVLAAEPVPKSNKLLKLTIDLGEEAARTVVAGIAKRYAADEVVGRQVVVVANLKPAKLMGVVSQGMVLAASRDGEPILLSPEVSVPNGTQVR